MKKQYFIAALCLILAVLFSACASGPTQVKRVDSSTSIDLSGRWNDADVRLVSDSLIRDCLNSPRVAQFIQQYSSRNKGKLPACVVGAFKNDSSEHIDTSIVARNMEMAILNSGKMDFVAGGDTLDQIRNEKLAQLEYASEETAVSLANETGAVLLLIGSVKSVVDRAGNVTTRSYFVTAELIDVEKRTKIWMGSNDEIKKVITQSRVKL